MHWTIGMATQFCDSVRALADRIEELTESPPLALEQSVNGEQLLRTELVGISTTLRGEIDAYASSLPVIPERVQ